MRGSAIAAILGEVHSSLSGVSEGEVATYIPQLSRARPEWFGIAVATVDGRVYEAGDAAQPFTIQSVSKPFLYGYALREYGQAFVLDRVGVEPTGEAFNSIVLDKVKNRPFNPMVNSGAIAVAGLMKGRDGAERRENMLALLGQFAGRRMEIDRAVYASEDATGHWNRAIAYMMMNSGMIERDPAEVLEVYFQQCSVLVTARDLALMAATLANDGVQPVSGERVLGREAVRDVLSVMMSCGMYNYAGQWAFEVGLPAKSGVSGAVMAVIPGQVGLCAFSPPLDAFGNSVRGVMACQELSRRFDLHTFSHSPGAGAVVRSELRGDAVGSTRLRTLAERAVLEREGRGLAVLELQGALFFGSVERILRRAAELAGELRFLVIDFKRVQGVDDAAVALLARACGGLEREGCTILLSHLESGGPHAALHAAIAAIDTGGRVEMFPDTDAALEWCEEAVLAAQPDGSERTRFALARLDAFKGLSREECRLLEAIVQAMHFEKGEVILREGDPARLFFVVAKGTVSVSLTVEGGRRKRIACVGPGLTFGEMALLDGGSRSADVIADETVICYGLAVESLRELAAEHPNIMTTILGNLTREFSARLRRANRTIRALE